MKPIQPTKGNDGTLNVPIHQINVTPGAIDANGVLDLTSGEMNDVFDIRDYGAMVDGVTNDAAAVIAATDAAIAAGGGTVYFPSGVTYYASNLGADGATTTPSLIFQGTGNSIITFGSTVPVLSIGNCNAVTFQNLVFIGTSGAIVPTYRTIVLGFNAQAVFNNCQFYGLGTSENDLAAGVITASSTPLIVTDCLFVGCSVPNGAVVTSSGGAGLRMNDTHFLDVGTFDGVAYSTVSKAAGGAWVRCTSMPNIQGANLKTALITNCTFDEAPLWGVRFDGSVVANQYNATVDNCHFNTGVDRGGGAYSGAIYATEMRQVTVKDTTAGFSNNTTDYAVAEFNNVDVVEMDNFRGIYGATYVTFSGTTSRVKLRNCTLAGFVTYPLGWNNSAGAYIDADTAMEATASATALAPLGRTTHVTGTTAVTSITATNFRANDELRLIFDDALTFTDGNNLKLAGNFSTGADDTISLVFDGTNFYETARSVN